MGEVAEPFLVVDRGGVADLIVGPPAAASALDLERLIAFVPACRLEQLGDPSFREAHGTRFACMAGAMANGIGSVEVVEAMGRRGMLGIFGAAGLPVEAVERAIDRIDRGPGDRFPFGFNLIHSPQESCARSASNGQRQGRRRSGRWGGEPCARSTPISQASGLRSRRPRRSSAIGRERPTPKTPSVTISAMCGSSPSAPANGARSPTSADQGRSKQFAAARQTARSPQRWRTPSTSRASSGRPTRPSIWLRCEPPMRQERERGNDRTANRIWNGRRSGFWNGQGR